MAISLKSIFFAIFVGILFWVIPAEIFLLFGLNPEKYIYSIIFLSLGLIILPIFFGYFYSLISKNKFDNKLKLITSLSGGALNIIAINFFNKNTNLNLKIFLLSIIATIIVVIFTYFFIGVGNRIYMKTTKN